jgi:hypothetical protein
MRLFYVFGTAAQFEAAARTMAIPATVRALQAIADGRKAGNVKEVQS